SARRFQVMAPQVARRAEALLDDLPAPGDADLTESLVVPFTVGVLTDLMGLPAPGRALFVRLACRVVRGDAEDDAGFGEIAHEIAACIVPLLQSDPDLSEESLLGMLVSAKNAGTLNDEETLSLVYQLFFAGHESSAYLLTNAIAVLLSRPKVAAALRDEPDLVDGAVEELLRWEGSVKVGSWRFATEPLELDGKRIEQGDPLLVVLAAANRDEERFPDADTLDIHRRDSGHLAFGHGPHHCLGAALGRVEATTLLSAPLRRFPEMELSVPYADLEWRHNIIMRGPRRLPVTLGKDLGRWE
ncbi:cytochrome P450, partial [Streptomyces sp. TRM76130]|nr:cytochrome P450 [Streptomyces sp. TRM76130]